VSVPLDYDHRSTTLRTVVWLAYSVFLSAAARAQERPDAQLLVQINQITAVDNHSHALSVPGQTALDHDIPNPLVHEPAVHSRPTARECDQAVPAGALVRLILCEQSRLDVRVPANRPRVVAKGRVIAPPGPFARSPLRR
jgi:hypothetical protein